MTTTTSFTNKEHHLGLSLSLGLTSTASTTASASSLHNHERTGGGVPVAAGMRTQAVMPFQMMFSPAPHSGTGGGFSPFGSTHFVKYNHLPWTESPSVPFTDRNIETIRETTAEARASSSLRGIDVNRIPAADTEDDDAGVSSPNSTISSVSGKRTERDNNSNIVNNENNAGGCDDDIAERTSSRGGGSDDDDGDTSRKKLRLSRDQSALLEETFKEHSTLNPKQKLALAKRLGLRPRQVEVWFQNRRARTKLKQTEVDCEFLKRCCEQLTEENRRLQKEVQDLRALKLSPQFYMQMTPPTTLTMCPSCERVGVPPSSNGPPVQPVDPKAGISLAAQRAGGPVHPAWIGGGPVAGLARPFEGVGLNGPR